jgi:hypothetical protein
VCPETVFALFLAKEFIPREKRGRGSDPLRCGEIKFDRNEAQKHTNLDSCIIQKGKDIFALALDVVLGQEYRN